jgi:hypothetical protein
VSQLRKERPKSSPELIETIEELLRHHDADGSEVALED